MRKLLVFLMIAIPLVVILVVNVTVDAVAGIVIVPVDRVSIYCNDEHVDREFKEDEKDVIELIKINDIFKTIKLVPKIYPESASNKTVYWESANTDIAVVDAYGNVSFVGFGKTQIYLINSDGTKRTSCYVDITDTKVHNISIVADKTEMEIGSSMTIRAAVSPSTAADKSYTLTSSNTDVLTINDAGDAVAVSSGEATIIAVANDKSIGYSCTASIVIKVVKSVESVKLDREEEHLTLATDEFRLNATISPIDASNLKVIYTTTDPLTASVSNNGIVKFHKAGSVVITVITEDGGYTDSINLTYTGGYPSGLTIKNNKIDVNISKKPYYEQIEYYFSPENPPIQNIEYSSSNTSVAIVDNNGSITILGGGEATITIKVQTQDDVYSLEYIQVFAEQKIDEIIFDKDFVITASEQYQILPICLPNNATDKNNLFYEIISGDNATISSDGLLTFANSGKVVVKITDNSPLQTENVSSTITVAYTGGYPTNIILDNDLIELSVDESQHITFRFSPFETSIRNYSFEIKENIPVYNNSQVLSLDQNGKITGLSGGRSIVLITVEVFDVESNTIKTISKECEIIVNQYIDNIELLCEEEIYENYYISSNEVFNFTTILSPLDLTNTDIVFELSDPSIAKIINNNQVLFNKVGMLSLTVYSLKNPNIKTIINLWYTGGCVVDATTIGLPEKIIGGESIFDLSVSQVVPANAINRSFKVAFINQSSDNLFSIKYNSNNTQATITSLKAGTATINISMATSDGGFTTVFTKEITALQKVSNIEFPYQSQIISSMQYNLQCRIYPDNAAQREIIYSLPTEYQHLANINGSILTFNASDNQSETVVVIATLIDIDNEESIYTDTLTITSTLGKITNPEGNQAVLAVGNSIEYDFSAEILESTELNIILETDNLSYSLSHGRLTITAEKEGVGNIIVKLINKTNQEILKVIDNIEITVLINIDNIYLSSPNLTESGNKFISAQNDIELFIDLLPVEASKDGLLFTVSDASIASFDYENNILHFYKTGTIELTISSPDNSFSRSFVIQYTGGKALSYTLNIEKESALYISKQYSLQLSSFIPENAQLFITDVEEILSTGASTGTLIEKTGDEISIMFNKAGNIKLKIQLSDGNEKIIFLNVISSISEILFDKTEIITAAQEVQLKPSLHPTSAIDKSIVYSVSDSTIATVSSTGLVSFIKPGTVIITVKSTLNEDVFATCNVISTLGDIHNFTLNYTELTMSVGESRELLTNYFPSNATNVEFIYEIVSSIAGDGSLDPVISIDNTTIRCLKGGEAIIKVYIINQNGEEISQICSVLSIRDLTKVSISFDRELDRYQNYFITSLSQLNLIINLFPADATVLSKDIFVNNEDIAKIQDGKLIFLTEGVVNITTVVNSRSETITVRYTNSAVSFEFDENDIQMINGVPNITISTGEIFEIKVKNVIPSDLYQQIITLTTHLNSSNYNNHNVSYAIGSSIYGENGGYSIYKVAVNGWTSSQMLRVNVVRLAESIITDTNIITPYNEYPLSAYVLPYDTSDPSLTYTIISPSSSASINSSNIISFGKQETVQVEIKNTASGLTKIITIEYLIGAKEIVFTNTQSYVFIGETLQLLTRISPVMAEGEPIEWSVSNPNLATIHNGLLTPKKTEGVITITARLKNYPETAATIQIQICAIVHSLTLNLKNNEDAFFGIAGTRVFGVYSMQENLSLDSYTTIYDSITNKRTLTPSVSHNSSSTPQLIWTSSDTSIATVENGVITILKAGSVKISCAPLKQYYSDSSQRIEASYIFTFIDGININSASDFEKWNKMDVGNSDYAKKLKALNELNSDGTHPTLSEEDINKVRKVSDYSTLPAVMQKDIRLNNEKRVIIKSLYGNGYMLDLQFNSKPGSGAIVIKHSITINNVHFRGYTFSDGGKSLSKLQDKANVIKIVGPSDNTIEINFKNCFVNGGSNAIDLRNAKVNFSGCILQNAYYSLIAIGSSGSSHPATDINLKNCILDNALIGCIISVADHEDNSRPPKLTFSGKVYMFNWQEVSQYQGFTIKDYSMFDSELTNAISRFLKKYQDIKTFENKKYIHMGVIVPSVKIDYLGFDFQLNKTFECEFINNTNIHYKYNKIQDSVLGVADYSIILYNLGANHGLSNEPIKILPNHSYSSTEDKLYYHREIRDLT